MQISSVETWFFESIFKVQIEHVKHCTPNQVSVCSSLFKLWLNQITFKSRETLKFLNCTQMKVYFKCANWKFIVKVFLWLSIWWNKENHTLNELNKDEETTHFLHENSPLIIRDEWIIIRALLVFYLWVIWKSAHFLQCPYK